MAKRLSLDDKLAAVRRLRDHDPSPERTAELKTAIDDRPNLFAAITSRSYHPGGVNALFGAGSVRFIK